MNGRKSSVVQGMVLPSGIHGFKVTGHLTWNYLLEVTVAVSHKCQTTAHDPAGANFTCDRKKVGDFE